MDSKSIFSKRRNGPIYVHIEGAGQLTINEIGGTVADSVATVAVALTGSPVLGDITDVYEIETFDGNDDEEWRITLREKRVA